MPINGTKINFRSILTSSREQLAGDQEKWQAHALFLSTLCNPHGDSRLTPRVINTVWNQVRDFAGVDKDKTPHSARHGMGAFIMEKTAMWRRCNDNWGIRTPLFHRSIRE